MINQQHYFRIKDGSRSLYKERKNFIKNYNISKILFIIYNLYVRCTGKQGL